MALLTTDFNTQQNKCRRLQFFFLCMLFVFLRLTNLVPVHIRMNSHSGKLHDVIKTKYITQIFIN